MTSDDVRVLRASAAHYRRWLRSSIAVGGVMVLALAAIVLRTVDTVGAVTVAAIVLTTPLLAVALVTIHLRTSGVRLGPGRVTEYRRWGRTTVLRHDDDLVGLLAVWNPTVSNGPATPLLVMRRRDGGARITLSGAYWSQDDLEAVAHHAGVPVRSHTYNAKGYERLAPGAMPWRERHYIVFGLGAAIVIVAVVAAAVFGYAIAAKLPPYDDQPPRAVSAPVIASQDALLADLQRATGGQWEQPTARLTTCKGDDDDKGWSRRLSADLATTEDPDTGEGDTTTPISPTREIVAAVGRVLIDRGYQEPYVDSAELAAFDTASGGYLPITGYPADDDDLLRSVVDVTFSGDKGRVSISMHSACETPRR